MPDQVILVLDPNEAEEILREVPPAVEHESGSSCGICFRRESVRTKSRAALDRDPDELEARILEVLREDHATDEFTVRAILHALQEGTEK